MADNRLKYVRLSLAEISQRASFILDHIDRAEGEVGMGDTLEFPAVSALTVTADGNTATTAQTPSSDNLTLTVSDHPCVFIDVPAVAAAQNLAGGWADALGGQAMRAIRNSMDSDYLSNVAKVAAWDTGASYVSNVAGDTLTKADFVTAQALLADQDGSDPQNFMWVLDAWAVSALMNLSEFHPNGSMSTSELGVPQVGTLFGAPVFMGGRSVPRQITAATSAVTISSNEATATVSSGHGILAGETITTTGLTTDVSAVTVTSVTATSVVYPCTASNGAFADGVGTITTAAARNLLIDKSYSHAALQKVPSTRIVDISGRTASELQISAIWGSATRSGRAVQLLAPAGSL
jgi:hypothetical protein